MDLGYIKERTSFRYDINKSKEDKSHVHHKGFYSSYFYIYFYFSKSGLAAVFFLMTAEAPIFNLCLVSG